SIGIHVLLLAFLALNPDLLTSTPKRIITVLGQDYDLSKSQVVELAMPPDSLRPKPQVPSKPLVEPPVPKPENVPQPRPQPPPPVIGPDEIIKEGARPDAQPNRSSRGDTTEQARAGGQQEQEPKPEQPKPQQAEKAPAQIAQNTNPNALRSPNLMDSLG